MGPAFNRLWAGSIVSNLADGVLIAAAPLLAITLTDSTVLISVIGAMVMLPWLLFAIPIGGLVDRINRRHMLALANTIRLSAALLLAFTVGYDLITLPILLLAVFLFGVGEVIYDTTLQSARAQYDASLAKADQAKAGAEKIITKNGESYVALIDADRLAPADTIRQRAEQQLAQTKSGNESR